MAMFPLTQILVRKVLTVPGNSTVAAVPLISVDDASRIVGVVQSNVAVTVNVRQGSGIAPTNLEYVSPSVAVAASAAEGAGSAFDMSVVGGTLRVDVVNGTGGAATVSIYVATKGI